MHLDFARKKTMTVQQVKQRFSIIGNSVILNRAIDIAMQVAPTDLAVLISGESGTGKEVFPQIIHQFSPRKHGQYIALNCGAIPEGTIDSELFGHEKGAFTGAHDTRKGYFEVANNSTIFLDEISELPLSTQVRLLRVLELGEFIKVGSSKVQKTNVRVVAATNINITEQIQEGKFREDLYYRINTVPITIPSLNERKEDIYLLFKKFANDFAEHYHMPTLRLDNEAQNILISYRWPGNIRQLKNITEQISIIEQERLLTADTLRKYLPVYQGEKLPALYKSADHKTYSSEREILFKILFEMRADMNDLKKLVLEILQNRVAIGDKSATLSDDRTKQYDNAQLIQKLSRDLATENLPDNNQEFHRQDVGFEPVVNHNNSQPVKIKETENPRLPKYSGGQANIQDTEEIIEESLSLQEKEQDLIKKALLKHKGKRKYAAQELGISERTLYRKIKEYDI